MPRKPTGMPNGRPRKTVNWEEFDKLCALQCTIGEFECYFNMHSDTIENICKREKGMTFTEYFELKRQSGKIALRRRLFWKALNADTDSALIFLSKQKQYLDFSDNTRTVQTEDLSDEAKLLAEEIKRLIASR
jgi:hypothetical protein